MDRAGQIESLAKLFAPVAIGGLIVVLSFAAIDPMKAAVFAFVGVAGFVMFSLPAADSLRVYIVYLMFEGALKIFSNYNPIIHVGSDIVLIVAIGRLWTRRLSPEDLPGPDVRARIQTVITMLVVLWIWVGVQFLNPWGLGFLPSVAGLKIYAVPMIMFFSIAFFLTKKEIESLPGLLAILALFQAVVALADWSLGQEFLSSLHPQYQRISAERFEGVYYRPFGTTNNPGGPSIWMFHASVCFLFVLHKLRDGKQNGMRLRWFWRSALLVALPLCGATLLVCQVRSVALRVAALVVVSLCLYSRKSALATIAVVVVLGSVIYGQIDMTQRERGPRVTSSSATEQVLNRFGTLTSRSTWENAREGAWDGIVGLAEHTLLGIGLSRTGASSSPWKDRIRRDPIFGNDWSFTDNLFRTLFTEIGLFGLVSYLLLGVVLVSILLCGGTYVSQIAGIYCFLLLANGFVSEGVIYQPDSSLFWMWGAIGIRYSAETKSAAPEEPRGHF